MSVGGGSSKSTSTPVDMTPTAFKGLQGPLAQRLAGLMGFTFGDNPTTTPGTIGFNPTGAGGVNSGPTRRYISPEIGTGVPRRRDRDPRLGTAAPVPGQTGGLGSSINGFDVGDDGLGGLPQYNGPLTATIGKNEQSILDMLMKQASGTAPDSDAVTGLKQFMERGLNGNAATDNPFLQSYIQAAQRPTLQGLEETLTRSLPGRFTQAGQFVQPQGSSAFDRAAAIATRGAADANADIATNISYNQVNDAQNRGLEAAKSIPGATAQEVDTLIKNLKEQALPRLIQDQGIDRGLGLFQTRLDALMKTLGITAGVTQPTIANDQKSKSSQFSLGLK